ncbi:S46 family peptidase [Flavobacteriales bacterium]|nr:S46 family peptidase [Flavobacteriales bacterium]MDB4088451.1 S46 family peptidase [Flavobacteriales bacterium]
MKNVKYLLVSLLISCSFFANATEGMWLPNLLKALNYSDMQSKGLMITAEELYSVNQSSMKDAVAHFNGGCTSEVVSNKGLLFTNHHCGYSQIANHSSVENNYLKDGFWAMNFSEEKINKGLYVDFIVRIDDVTSKMIGGTKKEGESDAAFAKRKTEEVIKELTKGTKYLAKVKPFNYGNKYFAFVIERFTDIRLVGAPPSSIGKFGFDTDNWVWPRHTGDFSVFRIYSNKDNKPAEYSAENVPYTPKHHFPVSLAGVKEGDFSMVYGFPGRTQQFLTSYAVDQKINRSNPARILMREKSLEVINATMKESEEMRIKYSSYQSRVSNAWKKWKGENFGLIKEKALDKKLAKEAEFTRRINLHENLKIRFGNLLPEMKKLYKNNEKYQEAFDYYVEMIYSGPATVRYLNGFVGVIEKHEKLRESGKLDKEIEKLKKSYEGYITNSKQIPHEKRMWKNMYSVAMENVDKEFHPDNFNGISNYVSNMNNIIDEMFEKSCLLGDGKLMKRLNKPTAKNLDKIKKDKGYIMVKEFYKALRGKVLTNYYANDDKIQALMKTYSNAIQIVFPNEKYWYDANSTLRVSYGKIEGSRPRDGMQYSHYTTAEGIMAKYIPNNDEFDVPEKLITLIENKDYGQYASTDNELVICFTGSNHTTGGNSGSPVINGKGELIGINFDRSWESTMSDVMFSADLCRNITVDIRYVLFVIDKYAGASHLIKEMDLVGLDSEVKAERVVNEDKIETINNLIVKSPDNSDLYYKRGKAYFDLGELKKANEDFKKAVVLDPKPEYLKMEQNTNKFLKQIQILNK